MRKLIATVFNYSLDGLLTDEGTEFWKFCFDLPENREPDDPAQLDFLQSAYAHIMGRTAYEAIAGAMTTTATDHPFADILNAGRKVVFSRTLKTAEWANTTIAAGDTAEEIDKLSESRRRPHRGLGRRQPLAVAHAARPDRRAPGELVPLRCGRGHPAVRRRPQVLPTRPGLQHRLQQRDRRAAVPPASLTQWPSPLRGHSRTLPHHSVAFAAYTWKGNVARSRGLLAGRGVGGSV